MRLPGGISTPMMRAINLLLTLTLFVAFVRANDADHTAALDDFAMLTQFFN
jgi:hypothetical protein